MNLTDSRPNGPDSHGLTADEDALTRCGVAADLVNAGQYERAREALGRLWRGVGARPDVEGLWETTAAEVLLQCGALTGWLGSSKKVEGAQERAKDLLGEARRLFEAHGLRARVAEAEYELGVCYWRAGALDEARVMLQEAARKADAEQRAKILIRGTVVETSAGRYNDALRILREAEPLFETAPDAVKGRWHAQTALVLRRLGTAERRADYLDRAIIEYTAAIYHFGLTGHERYCANNENNLAFLLYKLGRHEEAHEHLDRAQRVFARLEDAGSLAQVRETRARVYLAEAKYERAAGAIGDAVGALEQAGELALLADALAVQAVIDARRGNQHLSLDAFRRAVEVAEQAGAAESAGTAALSLLEDHLPRLTEREAYEFYARADDLLRQSQDAELTGRLRAVTRALLRRFAGLRMREDFSLTEAVDGYEASYVERALADCGGSVSSAAKKLGVSRQHLAYLLETRHRSLLGARTPAKKRRQSLVKKRK